MFCPKCGSLLKPAKGTKKMSACSCGYKEKSKKLEFKEKKDYGEGSIPVIEEEPEVHAKTKAECSKCGNKEAYFWEVQTRAADEAPTKFLKCTKCKHIWRDYG